MIHNITIKCYDDYIVNWQLLIYFSVYPIEINSHKLPGWNFSTRLYQNNTWLESFVWNLQSWSDTFHRCLDCLLAKSHKKFIQLWEEESFDGCYKILISQLSMYLPQYLDTFSTKVVLDCVCKVQGCFGRFQVEIE